MLNRLVRSLISRCLWLALAGLISATFCLGDPPPGNILLNGSFTTHDKAGVPLSWTPLSTPSNVSTGHEVNTDDNGVDRGVDFVSVNNTDAASSSGIRQLVPLNPEWAKVLIRGWIRVSQITPPSAANGPQPMTGVGLEWISTSGKTMPPIDAQTWSVSTFGWVEINQLLTVPEGAEKLSVTPQVAHVVGSADFYNLSLVGFVATFADEFDGSAVNATRWTVSEGPHDNGESEQEWFAPDHVTVSNGILQIHAEEKAHGDLPYQSGEITSKDKFQQQYGLFEFRLKLPETSGAWPAAYLLKYDDSWPPEIDVEELSGRDTKTVLETNHFADDYGRHSQSQVNWDGSMVDRTDWHTYAIVWEAGALAWYFDGEYKGTTNAPLTSRVPMYVRLNLAIGAFGGDPTVGTWPQDFDCHYVHVYQRNDLPLPLYPEHSIELTLPDNTAQLHAISCNPMTGATATWSLLDGPGKARIADPHSLDTSATFDAPGMYRLQVVVTKGASTAAKELLVYVNPALGGH